MADNPRVFGKYDVIRRLAVGGMGEIFLARQTGMAGFERLVILKSLLPQLAGEADQLAQFLDEARIVGSINHPNVVACYEVGEWEGVYFIAMEYINGVDVATLQKAADEAALRFPIHVAVAVTREAALGLDSAHLATDPQGRPLKIVHRDISPHNVMVRHDGLTKVVDFGVAMATNRQNKRTEGGLLKGKLGYMAPEQIKAQPLDGRSDQFSLGVLLWELLTGRRLFTAEDPSAVFMKIIREKVPPPSSLMPDVPKELDAIVLKMTAQEPADRFGRLGETAAVLRKFLEQRGAMEDETAGLVRDLVGGKLAERVRDLSPAPVRILGIQQNSPLLSSSFCKTCGAQAVSGDRFCRNCGAPIGGRTGAVVPPAGGTWPPPAGNAALPSPPPTSGSPAGGEPGPPPPIDDAFALEAVDAIDIAFDDASGPAETAVMVGLFDLVDAAGSHTPPEAMLRPVLAHLDELAARFDGATQVDGGRLVATFHGNARAARHALAFARRASLIVTRSARDLRLRAGISAAPGLSHGDSTTREDAERVAGRARPGTLWLTERARRLAGVSLAWGMTLHVQGAGGEPNLDALEVPQLPRVVGRGAERLLLEQSVAAADVGRGQQLLLIGDAGLGKSTLLDLADAEARDRGFIVGRARCGARAARPRYDTVCQVIQNACLELLAVGGDAAPWHDALAPLGVKAADAARLRALVDGTPFASDAEIPLSRRRVLLRAAVHAFFQQLVDRRGASVLLDDVHLADAPSLDLFAEVAARLGAARFLILAASRPAQGERVLPLARRAVLGPMEPKELQAVAAQAIAAALPLAVAEKLALHAAGSPLFAASLARHLVRVHLLRVVGGDAVPSPDLERFPLPPTLGVVLFAAHALLSAPARALLLAAAPAGQRIEPVSLALAAGLEGASAAQSGLLECVAGGALVLDEASDTFSFPTGTERELAAARVAPDVLAAQQRRVLAWLEARPAHERTLAETALLTHCAEDAGDAEAAAVAAEHAAEAAARVGAADAMGERYRDALRARWRTLRVDAITEDAARRALALAARAGAAAAEVDPAAGVDLALPFLRRLPPDLAVPERVEAVRTRASLLLKLRRTEEAQAALDEVLEQHSQALSAALQGSLLVDIAAALEQSSRPEAARTQLTEALRVLGQAPADERPRALDALLALARSHLKARDLPHARETLHLAREEAERRNTAQARIDVLGLHAAIEQAEGNLDGSLQVLLQALAVAGSVNDEAAEARVRQQQVRFLQQAGRIPDALVAARQARSVAQRIAWDEGVSVAEQMVLSLEAR